MTTNGSLPCSSSSLPNSVQTISAPPTASPRSTLLTPSPNDSLASAPSPFVHVNHQSAPQPQNAGEAQLFRVLQRANLLSYFDTFIAQGGDDVQQLCEAGEEEFLEIVSLVGMSKKPLHVRRLQKALQEWVTKPHLFSGHPSIHSHNPFPSMPGSGGIGSSLSKLLYTTQRQTYNTSPDISENEESSSGENSYSINPNDDGNPSASGSPPFMSESNPENENDQEFQVSPEYAGIIKQCAQSCLQVYALSRNPNSTDVELNSSKMNRKIANDIEELLKLPEDHPDRKGMIRKYSAIYGRFDSKRKPGRKLTTHEVTINEAAAQICFIDKSFLARRDELFILARQVLRDSGYQFKARRSRSTVKSEAPINYSCSSSPTMAKVAKYEDAYQQYQDVFSSYFSQNPEQNDPTSQLNQKSQPANEQGRGKSKLDNILENLRSEKTEASVSSSAADSILNGMLSTIKSDQNTPNEAINFSFGDSSGLSVVLNQSGASIQLHPGAANMSQPSSSAFSSTSSAFRNSNDSQNLNSATQGNITPVSEVARVPPPQPLPPSIWSRPEITSCIPQDDLDCFVSAWTVANSMQQALVKNEPISP